MEKKSIKLKSLQLIILLLIVTLMIIIFVNSLPKKIQHKNKISYGVSDLSNKIIDTGSEIDKSLLFENGFNLSFNQDLMEKRNYKILCFLDYKIVDFIVDGKIYSSYDFDLDKKDDFNKNIKIYKEKECQELSIAIIRMPYVMVDENDIERSIKTDDIISLRYIVKSDNYNKKIYTNSSMDFKKYSINQYDVNFPYLYVTKDINELKLITTSKEESNFFLMLHNKENIKKNYAVIALLNWEQIDINNKIVNFVSVPSKSIIYSKLSFPKIEKDSNYQILVFPKPYEISKKNYENLYIYGSHRIHLLIK